MLQSWLFLRGATFALIFASWCFAVALMSIIVPPDRDEKKKACMLFFSDSRVNGQANVQ